MLDRENTVYDLEEGEEVSCVFCRHGETYRRGEAYLAGPSHTPYDGSAHYVCASHLDGDAVIYVPPVSLE